MNERVDVEDRIRTALTGYASTQPESADRWADVVTTASRARVRRRTGAAALGLAALAGVMLVSVNAVRPSRERVETAPATAPEVPPTPSARSGDWDDRLFSRPALWPFRSLEEAQQWEQDTTGGRPSAYATPAGTALAFARSYLGLAGLDRVVSETVRGSRARVAIGYIPEGTDAATAAVLLLTRAGPSADGPWQVVGTDPGADPDLEITSTDASVPGTITVGGVITGVDESLRLQVRQPSSPAPLGEFCCRGAGGRRTPWAATVTTRPASDPVLTVVVATGGHVAAVERFEVAGLETRARAGGHRP